MREADLNSRLCGRSGMLCPAPELWMGCTDRKAFALSNKINYMVSSCSYFPSSCPDSRVSSDFPLCFKWCKHFPSFSSKVPLYKMSVLLGLPLKSIRFFPLHGISSSSPGFFIPAESTWTKFTNLCEVSAHTYEMNAQNVCVKFGTIQENLHPNLWKHVG